ncbi:ABC transporter substrate-binding protein [Williamsia sterculiae]|uniref:Amino acid ABC transporter substrate-binding protein, PAAT family n=1 Tax=Williamsia sterculiae TaxID=1344003 RepID=A0A1N7H569_9NOCA|nr:ABC transporter substrate-binding protein [Williamsia sterculiae]SIS19979.1 amino acid ABC transporter substrate-binding protein, PAAT family [Williamsia sterculiae]
MWGSGLRILARCFSGVGAVAVLGVLTATVSGCTNSEGSSGAPSTAASSVAVTKDNALAAQLPDKVKSSGQLVVGVNVPYSPNEFKDPSGKIIGFDVDVVNKIGQLLGVTPQYKEADFAKIIPAVQANTYDMGMSSFTDNKEREKQVDMVTYFNAGSQWAEPAGKTVDPNNACGKKVAVQTTTVQDTDELPAKSKACTDAGKPAIDIRKYDDQDAATNALVLGQVDAMSADSPVTAYAIKQAGGKIEKAGAVFDSAPYGYPVTKGSALGPVLQKAVQKLIDNGALQSIAQTWGVQDGLIKTSQINGATS